MNARHDSRRAREDGNQRIGHDPRRGASSPQWNREAQMQHEQFQGRHGSPYDSPYGGQYGGYENSREPQPHRGADRGDFREDWYSAEGAMEGAAGRHAHQFGGYGDYDMDRRRFDDRLRELHGTPFQRQGQVPNQFSRDEHLRGSAAQGRHSDPDYARWREEQLQQLDEDYEAYRRERYGKFAEDFNAWRANRRSAASGGGTDSAGEDKPGSKQQG